MKKVIVEFPIVGWASVTIEVEDDLTTEDVEYLIRDDEIEVPWNPASYGNLFPVLSLREFVRTGGDGETPLEMGVVE